MTAYLRAAVHANFKDVYRVQETRKEKEFSRKSIIDSQEQVLNVIVVTKEYENPFAFSSIRKSKLKSIVTVRVRASQQHNRSKGSRVRASELFH